LVDLLEKGALAASEGGKTTAEQLQSLTTKKRADGIDGAQLTREVVAALDQPDQQTVYQGDNRYTCAATNLERQLADSPAKFSALAEGLSSPEGRSELGLFPELRRAEGSQFEDGSGRNTVNRLIQGALMTVAGEQHGGYDVAKDSFGDNSGKGLKTRDIARLTAYAQSENQAVVVHDGGTHQEFERLVRSAQPGQTFQLGVSWKKGQDHMLLFQGREGEEASYFDPQAGQSGTMPLKDLLFKTQMAIFPQSRMQGVSFPADAVAWGLPQENKGAP
jgi:hypothetical protein